MMPRLVEDDFLKRENIILLCLIYSVHITTFFARPSRKAWTIILYIFILLNGNNLQFENKITITLCIKMVSVQILH